MGILGKMKKKAGSGFFIALDIGSHEIKALLCVSEGKKGVILGVGRKKQDLTDMNSGSVLDIASVIENCKDAINAAEKDAGIGVEKVIIGISGDFVKGATHTTTYIRRDPNKKMDLAELKNIIQKVQWRSFEVIRSQISLETGYNEIDIKLVNASVVDTRVDGYKVENPIGFQGKEIELSIFNSFAPLEQHGILQTLAVELDLEIIAISSEPYSLAKHFGKEGNKKSNTIIIDIGASSTEIAIVKEGSVISTKMFNMGGRLFTKRLAKSLKISFEDAEKIKISYSKDKLERQSYKIVREAMKEDCDLWISGVVLALNSVDKDVNLPGKIQLCGASSQLPEVKEALESRNWYKNLKFTKKPTISHLSRKSVENFIDETKNLNNSKDMTALSLANMALEEIAEEKLPNKVLKKVVRLMKM